MKPPIDGLDETRVTEITFQPDGRVYVFGLSTEVLAVLAVLRPQDARLQQLLDDLPKKGDPDDPPPG